MPAGYKKTTGDMKTMTTNSSRKAGTLQGVLLLLPITMAVMGLIVLVPVVPRMMEHFPAVPGVEFLIPLMLTLPALCVALLAPAAGTVVDRFGRRRTLIGALVLYAIAGIMPMFLDDLGAIIVSRIFVGSDESVVVTASTTLIGDYFHGGSASGGSPTRRRWRRSPPSSSRCWGALGNISWRAPFAAYAISLVYAVGLPLWTWEPVKSEQPPEEIAGEERPIPWGTMMPLAAISVFGGVMFFLMQIQVTNVLAELLRNQDAGAAGTVHRRCRPVGGRGLRAAVPPPRPRPRGDATDHRVRPDRRKLCDDEPLPAVPAFTAWLVVNQLGCGILLPMLAVLVMAALPFEFRGRGTGLFMTGWWLGQPLSAQLVPWVRGLQGGSLPAVLQVFGIVCIVAAVVAAVRRSADSRSSAASGA